MSQPIGMKTKPRRRTGFAGGLRERRCRGNHRIEQRKRECRAHAAKEGPTRQSFFGDDHNDFLMVNGVLLANPTMIDEKR